MRPFKPASLFLCFALFVGGYAVFDQWSAHRQGSDLPALVSHRAMYNVALSSLSSSGNMVGLKGLMVYEWQKSCRGWVTKTHSTLTYSYADGQSKTVNTDVTTIEDAAGKTLAFDTRRESAGVLDEHIEGHATHKAAEFVNPSPKTLPLGADVLFPMQHTFAAYRHAKAGDTQFTARVFDGADTEGPMLVNTLIDAEKPVAAPQADLHIDTHLITKTIRPYRFSFFKDTADDGVPEYEMQVDAQANGVVRSLDIIYDGFSVKQTLKALQPLEDAPCKP